MILKYINATARKHEFKDHIVFFITVTKVIMRMTILYIPGCAVPYITVMDVSFMEPVRNCNR